MMNRTQPASNYNLRQAIAFGVFVLAASQAYATDYSYTDLGTAGGPYSTANAINNANQSTGINSRGTPTEDQGWVLSRWDGATLNTISDPGRFNGAWAINSSGAIAGGSSRAFVGYIHAAIWNGGTRTDLNDLGGATDPNDHRWSIGSGINDAGQVIGTSVTADQSATKAVLWNNSVDPTVLSTLGGASTEGNGINNAGRAVGVSFLTGDEVQHAALWNLTNGDVSDLGTLGGTNSSAMAINATGQIVGWSDLTNDIGQHATYWNGADMTDLGTLDGANSQALALNNAGQIVGWSETADGSHHATLWSGDTMLDLNSLLDPSLISAGWVLSQAAGINDNGWIVGTATNSLLGILDGHAFLLSPTAVPVPAAIWLFGSALAGFMGLSRRKVLVA
jgi:probable HAF family extracellular repeat protein